MQTARRYPSWFLPVFSLALGAGCLAALWVGGDPAQGLISFAILAALGLVFAVGGRSETIRGLRGDGRDEYWARLDLTATTLTGLVLICAVIGMCFWEWAHGRDGTPYSQLGAVAGLAYVVALVVLRLRS
jgi:membrane protein YdbS with pleckstrin-like domain